MEAKNGRIHPNSVSNRVKVTLNHNWILLKLKHFWNIWILNLISLKWKMIWICAVGFSRGEFQVLQMKTCSRVTFCCSAVEGFQLLFWIQISDHMTDSSLRDGSDVWSDERASRSITNAKVRTLHLEFVFYFDFKMSHWSSYLFYNLKLQGRV